MKRFLIISILLIAGFLKASSQLDSIYGIAFLSNITWAELLQRARAENKYVFVDCYASWCEPCKRMDKEVYSNDTVGELMTPKFLSVKIQMDTSKQDNETIQSWYATAHDLAQQYKITAYPSFLFFSPDGEILHRDLGFRDVKGFIDML